MSGSSKDSFRRALDNFKNTISPDLAQKFASYTLEDVKDACKDIQNKHGREGKLQNMQRLDAFIEAMGQLGKTIELFVNVNAVVCFVWAPIKFILGVAETYRLYFDKLLDMYAQIGGAIPALIEYRDDFEKNQTLATALQDYYEDILKFHEEAIYVFARPRWRNVLDSAWKTFETRFATILRSIDRKRGLLESVKLSVVLHGVQEIEHKILPNKTECRQQIDLEIQEKHKSCIRARLQVSEYPIDQGTVIRQRHDGDCGKWIFKDLQFEAWFNSNTLEHRVLYVNGMPGAGKTTLMSTVIEKLFEDRRSGQELSKYCVAYFYFKHGQKGNNTHYDLLRGILNQVVSTDPVMSDHIFGKISAIAGARTLSTDTLQSLVKIVLESYKISYIVLDGLDECDECYEEESIKWFLSLVDGGLDKTGAVLRVLFCGQRDGTLNKLLTKRPSISLENSSHAEDINRYCRAFSGRIEEKFRISPICKEEIITRVTKEAQGMFLYAHVVLNNLLSQTKLNGLIKEMEHGTFPQGIEDAYKRVAVRIFEQSHPAVREDAMKILGYITCAPRPLRWREIQSFFCIDPNKGTADYKGGRLLVTCKDICGSFVEVHCATKTEVGPEDFITIVHETARQYLYREKWLNTILEHAKLTVFCLSYLTSQPFSSKTNEAEVTKHALCGYYALQDYAIQHWFNHFQECIDLIGSSDPSLAQDVMESANSFIKSYGLVSKMSDFFYAEGCEEGARIIKELPKNEGERNAYLNIEYRTNLIRRTIELLQDKILDPEEQETLTNLHGAKALYKCSKSWCKYFTDGFSNVEERKKHVNRHDRPFHCCLEECFAFQLGYDTQDQLDQHKKRHHPDPTPLSEFPKVAKRPNITTLHAAVTRKDLAAVKALLDYGASPNESDRRGKERPLYRAVGLKSFEICKLLVERGDTKEPTGSGGRTSLHRAVETGDLDIVQLLLSKKQCKPDVFDDHARTPYLEACTRGHLDIVKLLLGSGEIQFYQRPDIHPDGYQSKNNRISTPLGYACMGGHFLVVEYLLQQGQSKLVDVALVKSTLSHGHKKIADNLLSPIISRSHDEDIQALRAVYELYKKNVEIGNDWTTTFCEEDAFPIDLLYTFENEDMVQCISFSYNGKRVAIGCSNSVRIYDIDLGVEICTLKGGDIDGGSNVVNCICFNPDGTCLATGTNDKLVSVWDIQSREIRKVFFGHEQAISSIDFSRDGSIIASGSSDKTIRFWNISYTGQFISPINTGRDVAAVAIYPDTSCVAAGFRNDNLRIWGINQGNAVGHFQTAYNTAHDIAVSPDGKYLVSGNSNGTLKLWEAPTAQTSKPLECLKTLDGHKATIKSVAFTFDGNWIISSCHSGKLQFYDLQTGRSQFFIQKKDNLMISVASSPTGRVFAAASGNKVYIWLYTCKPK